MLHVTRSLPLLFPLDPTVYREGRDPWFSRKHRFRGSFLPSLLWRQGWPLWTGPSLAWERYLVVLSEPSSGIFSSEQLLPESRSRCSSSSKRSATHWAVRRASGSWSQHSVRVSHTIWMPCRRREVTGNVSRWFRGLHGGLGGRLAVFLQCRPGGNEPVPLAHSD